MRCSTRRWSTGKRMTEPKIEFKLSTNAEGITERIYLRDGKPIVVLKHGKEPKGPGYFCQVGWLRKGTWLTTAKGPYDSAQMAADVADAVAMGIETITGGAEYLVPTVPETATVTDERAADSPTRGLMP